MNRFVYILFLSIFLLDFLSGSLGTLGRYVTWLPELLSMLAIFLVSGRFMLQGIKNVPPKVFVFLFLFLLHIVIGIIINFVPPGPIIAGFRAYLKFIPFFLLPFVYPFSSQQISNQLKLVLFLFIIQAPIALYQRLVITKRAGVITGDFVTGTVSTSGILTVALTCAIAVLMAFYVAKKINFKQFGIFFVLLFIPMTLNETKSTIVLLPIALILPMYFSSNGLKIKQMIPIMMIVMLAGVAFVFIYDHFMRPKWGYGIVDFLFMEGRTEGYLYRGAAEDGVHDKNLGRVDTYIIAIQTLYHNILNLLFGLGIGNVSESFLPSLSGEYAEKYSHFGVKMTTFTLIIWELGIVGIILYYALFFMIFRCARNLSAQDGFLSTFASGWSVVTILIMICLLYKSVFNENVISYLFWYFSGYIISEDFRYKKISS